MANRKNGAQRRTAGSRGILIYKTYAFRDKDPVIDELRTMLTDTGTTYRDVHEAGGPTEGTLYNWFKGETRKPTNAAVCATAGAMGYRRKWVKERQR